MKIFSLIQSNKKTEEIVQQLSEEYNAPIEEIIGDVQSFINDLIEKGIIKTYE